MPAWNLVMDLKNYNTKFWVILYYVFFIIFFFVLFILTLWILFSIQRCMKFCHLNFFIHISYKFKVCKRNFIKIQWFLNVIFKKNVFKFHCYYYYYYFLSIFTDWNNVFNFSIKCISLSIIWFTLCMTLFKKCK